MYIALVIYLTGGIIFAGILSFVLTVALPLNQLNSQQLLWLMGKWVVSVVFWPAKIFKAIRCKFQGRSWVDGLF